MKCVVCDLGPADGKSVFRMNEKGVPGIWACVEHRGHFDSPHASDTSLDDLVSALESGGPNE